MQILQYPCWGGTLRMKCHPAGTNKNVIHCASVPDEVKEMFKDALCYLFLFMT